MKTWKTNVVSWKQALVAMTTAGVCFGNAGLWQAKAGDVLAPVDFRQVHVGGEMGRRIDITITNNLSILDIEKDFLEPFRSKSSPKGSYVGLGKLIEAAVRFAAYTRTEKEMVLKKQLVEETLKAQEPDGYVGVMAVTNRVTSLWDVSEIGYLIQGLTTDYQYFGEKRSLAAARKLADFILRQWDTAPADWPKLEQLNPYTSIGLEYALLKLGQASGDQRYVEFCVQKRSLPKWDQGGARAVHGHAYGYVGSSLAQLELYRMRPSDGLLSPTRQAILYLTTQNGMTITGEAGQGEIFSDNQDGRGALGETCATAYLIRLYDGLLRLDGDPRYGDLMERTIYNGLFAAQSPDGRRLRYFTAMEGPRAYFNTDTYCCPCNYRRLVSELPTMVYYRAGTGLAVNLYTPSEATIVLDGGRSLKVRQETDYPTSGHIVIRLDPAGRSEFPLQLRIPRWCRNPSVTVNGVKWESPIVRGAFLTINRRWHRGDQVTLDLPMSWRLILGRKSQTGYAAMMRGPLVYCLNPALNDAVKGMQAADLKELRIILSSLKDLPNDNTVRPGGTACQAQAEGSNVVAGSVGRIALTLTEFPDPNGQCTYFRLSDPSAGEPDELCSGDGP